MDELHSINELFGFVGEGTQLSIYVKDGKLYGVMHEMIGRDRFEIDHHTEAVGDLTELLQTLDAKAHAWLLDYR